MVKKYSDWQKYVREQSEKLGAKPQPAAEPPASPPPIGQRTLVRKPLGEPTRTATPPQAPQPQAQPRTPYPRPAASQPAPPTAPERSPATTAPSAPAGGAAMPPPKRIPKPVAEPQPQVERRMFVPEETARPAAEAAEPEPRAESPLPAPFVSVHDVWKAAEKTSRGKGAAKRRDDKLGAPPGRQSRLPGIDFVPPNQTPTIGTPKKLSAQSRDEILERLVNPTVSLEEAAKIMGVCKATIRRYTAKGLLPHYRTPGNQRRFKLNEIIQFLENQRR